MVASRERAVEIAGIAHKDEKRLDGRPYVDHPLRVMEILKVQGYSEIVQIVGVLHDVVENNKDWSLARLRDEGFDEEVLDALALLTREKGVEYETYIRQLGTNVIATAVKLADMIHNLRDYPEDSEPSEWRKEKVEKYTHAILYLTSLPVLSVA